MDQHEYDQIMIKVVYKACEPLTDMELNSLYMAALLGTNPIGVGGYDKVQDALFTEDSGRKMHQTTLDAFATVWELRCGKKKV